jgi:hypothetical protein
VKILVIGCSRQETGTILGVYVLILKCQTKLGGDLRACREAQSVSNANHSEEIKERKTPVPIRLIIRLINNNIYWHCCLAPEPQEEAH